jgi:NAD(P)-dependent dehydrogenase (short-subunit alcohol dehydrogenase family)
VHQLNDRVALVTGAASGIGLALARQFAAEGMRLVMTDIDAAPLDSAAAAIRATGTEVEAIQLDVRDAEAMDRAARLAADRFGGLHIAVNNAGIVNGGTTWELPLEDWHAVIDVNLWGVIHGVRAFVPHILATGEEGHVVNIASMAAVTALGGLGPYTVAKHGVLGLSDVLRADLAALGAPIGVSVAFPGRIRTGMNPIGTVEPAAVATNVLDAIRRNRPYVFTDDHATDDVNTRLEAIIAARADVLPPAPQPNT